MLRVTDPETGEDFDLRLTDDLSEELRSYYEEECKHQETDVRRFTVSGGAVHYKKQCRICGELVGQAIAKALVPADVLWKDELIVEAYRRARKDQYSRLTQRHLRKQKSGDREWWTEYDVYLKTAEWHAKRQKVLKRARGICEGCGEHPATQVHHLSYVHVFNEFLFELVAICDGCHDRVHSEQNSDQSSERQDGFPCDGCCWEAEKEGGRWCYKFETYATAALADEDKCGSTRSEYEPVC